LELIVAGLLFGLASAVSWGAGDFAGGLASRRTSVLAALLAGQAVGLLTAGALLVASAELLPPLRALVWSGLAGLAGVVGLAALYGAMTRAPMGLVAPAVAVAGAGLAAVAGLLPGDVLTALQLCGLVAALAAVAVVSWRPAAGSRAEVPTALAAALPLVVLAGFGFAAFFLLMDLAGADGARTWWPVVLARCTSVAAVGVAAAAARAPLVLGRGDIPIVAAAGLGDVGGNVFFVLANANGPLSLAAVTSSLYPVTTVLLAWIVLGERLRRLQLVGVALALAGLVLIAG